MHNRFKHSYDLSQEWFNLTQLPFVFAVWIAKPHVDANFEAEFEQALEMGLSKKHELLDHSDRYLHANLSRKEYLEECMQYHFGESQKNALDLFFSYI